MRIDYPAPRLEPQLRRLWQMAFGDSEELAAKFFATGFSRRRCRCSVEDGKVAAALYWFDTEYLGQRFAYLYAVATHPDFRNRGLCRALVTDTLRCLAEQGFAGALLQPQDGRLREMYGRMGFRDCCRAGAFSCAAGEPAALRPVSAEEYARLRREYLPPDGVVQEGADLAYLGSYASFFAGADFLLACETQENGLIGTELLGNAGAAPGILGALGYPDGQFHTPGKALPGAMLCPLRQDVQAPGYFGLVLD